MRRSAHMLFVALGLLALWQGISSFQLVAPRFLPAPLVVFAAFLDLALSGVLLDDVLASVERFAAGFAIASALAVPLAFCCGLMPAFAEAFLPLVELLRPISPIAWIPLAILWFGIGRETSYFLVAIGVFFPVFTNTFFGVRYVPLVYKRAALCLGAKKRRMLLEIILPAALPHIFAGLRIALGVGWMCIIAAELVGAQSGLGYLIQYSRLLLDTPRVIAGMVVIGVIGFGMSEAMRFIELRCTPWHKEQDA